MNLKFSILTAILIFGGYWKASSQAKDPAAAFTLEECLAYAFENNDSVKNAILEQQIAKARVGEIRADGLPQINGNINLTYNLQVQTQFLPDFISPAVYGVLIGENVLPDQEIPEGGMIPAQFGTKYSGNASIGVEQLIFDGSYFVGLKAAATYRELSSKATIKTKIDVAEAVTKAYYAALIAQERIVLAEENFKRVDTLLNETQVMFDNGFSERIDVSRLKVQYNNAKIERQNAERAIQISFLLLKFQMGMPVDQLLFLEGNFNEIMLDFDHSMIDGFQYDDRIEYSQLETNQALAELDLKNNTVQYLPKINAFFNYGGTMGTNYSDSLFSFNDTWFKYSNVGVTLSLPIFDGLRKSYTIQQNRIAIKQIENSFSNLRNSIDLNIQQSRINLENSLQTVEAYKENMELAEEVAEVVKIKYQEGVGSNIEVVDAQIDYQTAETNYFNALYDALVAKVELEKALGILLDK